MGLVVLENEYGRAVVSAHAGATLRSLRARVQGEEHELLSGGLNDQLDEPVTPSGVGSFIMAPWVNRIHRGTLTTEHGNFKLPVDSGEHAIHGTVRHREWEVVTANEAEAEFRVELTEPWPFAGTVIYRVAFKGASLSQTLEVHAAEGERSFPAGVGWHPWFRRSVGSGELTVQADVTGQWEFDENVVPSGTLEETKTSRKLNDGGQFEVGEVDGCFQLNESRSAVLRWPELTLRMESSPEVRQVMVYSPVGSVCVEPQTTTVNAFQLAARGIKETGARILKPGDPLTATTVWSWGAS